MLSITECGLSRRLGTEFRVSDDQPAFTFARLQGTARFLIHLQFALRRVVPLILSTHPEPQCFSNPL
jgi:hypothetical protein